MMLEDIAMVYGMIDYYDNVGMKIYKMSKAIDDGDTLLVPVTNLDGFLLGHARMAKVERCVE